MKKIKVFIVAHYPILVFQSATFLIMFVSIVSSSTLERTCLLYFTSSVPKTLSESLENNICENFEKIRDEVEIIEEFKRQCL